MNQTELSKEQLETALASYPIAPLAAYSLATGGIENTNYLVTCTDKHRYVLTLLEQPGYCQHEHYVRLLDACEAKGLPIPSVIRTNTSATSIDVLGKTAMLSRFLTGAHVSTPTLDQLKRLGRFIARLHTATNGLSKEIAPYPRDESWLQTQLTELMPHLDYQIQGQLTHAVGCCGQMLRRQDLDKLDWGVIHGDLFRDNVLFNQYGLAGALDFHHASGYYLLFDLAVAANDWCVDVAGLLDAERSLALLRGYHEIKPLSTQTLWWFSSFCLYAATVFSISRLHTVHTQPQARSKDPAPFLTILQGHLRHPLTLDPRLFP